MMKDPSPNQLFKTVLAVPFRSLFYGKVSLSILGL
jgi:hypothetical protein